MSALVVLAAMAAVQTVRPSVITNPDWLRRPDGEAVSEHYPPLALALRIEGRATIGCEVDSAGALQDCRILSESPEGLGFGGAAQSLSRIFQMKPKTLDGVPVAGGHVRIPIRFAFPPRPANPLEQFAPFLSTLDPPPPSPEALDAAKRLAETMGLQQDRADSVRREVDNIRQAEAPGLTLDVRQRAADAIQSSERAVETQRAEAAVALLAGYMPLDAIEANLAFSKSPTPRVLAERGPALVQALTPAAKDALTQVEMAVKSCEETPTAACLRQKLAVWKPAAGPAKSNAPAEQLRRAEQITMEVDRALRASAAALLATDFAAANPEFRDPQKREALRAALNLALEIMARSMHAPLTNALAEQLPPDTLTELLAYAHGSGGQFVLSPQVLRLALAFARMDSQFSDTVQVNARRQFCATFVCESPDRDLTPILPLPKP